MERSEVEAKYRWRVEDIFPSDEAWEESYKQTEASVSLHEWAGKLQDAASLAAFFKQQEQIARAVERLYLYAHMRHDEDARVSKYTAMQSRAMSLYVRLSSETSFVEPELTALDIMADDFPGVQFVALAGDPEAEVEIINLRLPPEERPELVDGENFFPAYHMNKKNWVSVRADGVPERLLLRMIDVSYALTPAKRR